MRMDRYFAFVGELGDDLPAMKQAVVSSRLRVVEIPFEIDLVDRLADAPSAAAIVSSRMGALSPVLQAIRFDMRLSFLPVVLSTPDPSPSAIREAFRWGVDDYLVEGALHQFQAVVASVEKAAFGKVSLAPAGGVVVASEDPQERMALGRVLARNGFAVVFASNGTELTRAIGKSPIRAVIAAIDLPGPPLFEVMRNLQNVERETPPFVVVAPRKRIAAFRDKAPATVKTAFQEAVTDAENITFLLNELLSPPSKETRGSPRLLYGTTVSFTLDNGGPRFHGFSFNVNLGGLYIRTLCPPPLGTDIVVNFAPPSSDRKISVRSKVVWLKTLDSPVGKASPHGMGVQFHPMWPPDRVAYKTGYRRLLRRSKHLLP